MSLEICIPEVIIETTGRVLLESLDTGEPEDDLDVVTKPREKLHHTVIVSLTLHQFLPKFLLSGSVVRTHVILTEKYTLLQSSQASVPPVTCTHC